MQKPFEAYAVFEAGTQMVPQNRLLRKIARNLKEVCRSSDPSHGKVRQMEETEYGRPSCRKMEVSFNFVDEESTKLLPKSYR